MPEKEYNEKPVRNIAFSCHPAKESLPPLVQTMLKWTMKNKITSRLSPTMAKLVSMPDLVFDDKYLREQADMFVVLGGDGTILSAARDYAEYKLPIAGINLGHLGFMTLEEPKNAITALRRLKLGNYFVEPRMMLRTNVYRDGEKGCQAQRALPASLRVGRNPLYPSVAGGHQRTGGRASRIGLPLRDLRHARWALLQRRFRHQSLRHHARLRPLGTARHRLL